MPIDGGNSQFFKVEFIHVYQKWLFGVLLESNLWWNIFFLFGLFFDLFIPVAGEKIKIFQKITLENKNLDLFSKFMIIRSFFA